MTDETRARFDRLLAAVHEADRRLRDLQLFKHYVTELTRRHRQGELSDPEYIARMHDLVAHELLDDAPGGGPAHDPPPATPPPPVPAVPRLLLAVDAGRAATRL